MKKFNVVLSIILIMSIIMVGAEYVSATETSSIGTVDNPLVTKDYLDEVVSGIESSVGQTFKAVSVYPGDKIIGVEGTEMISTASGTANGTSNGYGILDVTIGEYVNDGEEIQKYHQFVIPRDDGRGITVTSKGTVLIKGEYVIK